MEQNDNHKKHRSQLIEPSIPRFSVQPENLCDDAEAVQRRQRNQVKKHQNEIDGDRTLKNTPENASR